MEHVVKAIKYLTDSVKISMQVVVYRCVKNFNLLTQIKFADKLDRMMIGELILVCNLIVVPDFIL